MRHQVSNQRVHANDALDGGVVVLSLVRYVSRGLFRGSFDEKERVLDVRVG